MPGWIAPVCGKRAVCPSNDNEGSAPGAQQALLASAIALADGREAAVTLQLDAARHVRLRLACAISGRSAQAIIGEALDEYLKTVPGIERLIADAMAESGEEAAAGWGSDI